MALLIMPNNYLSYFWETLDWIREEDHSLRQNMVCKAFEQVTPGAKPFNDIEMVLAIRKWESNEHLL